MSLVPMDNAPGSWGDVLGQLGGAVNTTLNRWLDVEAYNRTGGALLPGGQVQPGGSTVVQTTAAAGAGMAPLLLLAGGVVLLLLLRK